MASPDMTDPAFRHAHVPKDAMSRIKADYRSLGADPIPGVLVVPEEEDITLAHCLVAGPVGTPYAHGFFLFRARFPADYPASPPKVKFLTTGGGTIRFNPNLYADGKVCLSLLGTWAGPGWTPLNTLSSVLLSIQGSILNDAPMHNEPGWEEGTAQGTPPAVAAYSDIVAHETLRVAVLDAVLNTRGAMPAALRESMLPSFLELRGQYADRCTALSHRLDGTPFADPLWKQQGTFNFARLRAQIEEAADRVAAGDVV